MKFIHLLIVEPDPIALFSMEQMIRYFDNFLVVDRVENMEDALERLRVVPIDLVIIAENARDEKWKDIKKISNGAKMIFIAQNPSREFIQEAVKEGVWDVILRPVEPERLRFSLEMFQYRFTNMKTLEPPILQDKIDAVFFPREHRQDSIGGTIRNSEMLSKVMNLIKDNDGLQSAGEIAEVLNVSRITVRKYCEALVNTGKLRVRNKYQTKGRPIKQYFPV
ncbi:MAG: HTH domain-containing protein [Synergistaceae bacterium]|jgi:response regulator of citrate/malate metabolism|nr:HTH domain-containing protein [Synergistaceae bacterium]